MRSAAEIAYRLRQEATNLAFLVQRPEPGTLLPDRLPLPDPRDVAAAVRDTPYAGQVLEIAAEVRRHRFPLLGGTVDAGREIRWRRDWVSGKETGPDYFRLIPYLDASRAGDHKNIWELNRHQHLVLLAQAYLLGGGEENLDELYRQIESWEDANPFQRGINWASALEVAFRAMSWLWIFHLAGDRMPPGFRDRLLESLYRHGRHIENNLSFYFSPNTHLLGEVVALYALSGLFAEFRALAEQVVAEQMDKQVRDDGSHFEQSTYYHVYALDMFLFRAAVGEVSDAYRAKLSRIAEYLHAIMGPRRTLACIGDDDGGRLFHPYGARERFGRATLATCGVLLDRPEWIGSRDDLYEQAVWWLGPHALALDGASAHYESRLFADAGVAVMVAGDRHVLIDAGPFGPWGSGHSHSDTLSIVASAGEREILIDPGTYTYVGEERWRNWFRGSGAHNTVRIDGADQAVAEGPFRWAGQPAVRVITWESTPEQDVLDAECSYRGFTHRRRVRFVKPDWLHVTDEVSGPPGVHEIEQIWHPASLGAEAYLSVEGLIEPIEGWRSRIFGVKEDSPAVRVRKRGELPLKVEARIRLAD